MPSEKLLGNSRDDLWPTGGHGHLRMARGRTKTNESLDPFRVSLACEDFVLVFATTAGPKPDPCHAFAIRVPLFEGRPTGQSQKAITTPTCDVYWKVVTPKENINMFRGSIVCLFDLLAADFDFYAGGQNRASVSLRG